MKTLNFNPKYHQGYYKVQNEDKYVGDISNVIYRSSLERKFMTICDFNDKIIHWGSENIPIPYYFVIDKKVHNYWIDFFMEIKKDNDLVRYLVEIKPEKNLNRPTLVENDEITKLKNKKLFESWIKKHGYNKAKDMLKKRIENQKGINEKRKSNLRVLKNYQYEMTEYIKNSCKWEAAREFAKQRNCEFIVLTDKELAKI